MILLLALALLINLFPQVKDSSLIGAAGILSAAIEIIGFIRDRSDKEEDRPSVQIDQSNGPKTNVEGDQKNLFSGSFSGPTSAEGDAVDMRGSTGPINVFKGPVNIDQGTASLKERPIPRIRPPPQNFVGRDEDITEILSGFEGGAVIAGLRGMGGVGKTALALVLVERLAESYPDGQIFIDLKGTDKNPLTSAEAMAQVVRAYDPEFKMPKNDGELERIYISILHGKRSLLLLDNAASRDQVELLIPPKGCALLVTSRNKFALPGLTEKDLDVLPLDDAKELLLEICERIGDHAEELAKLCGCLPIALRNAASPLREKPNLSVANHIKKLGDAIERLELVEASFSTSYDLLTPELQRLWSLLSVFPADFDLAGAAAVWEMEETPAEDALGELMKWSLVDFSPSATGEGGRYRLHDLAHDFAGSRLDEAVRERARLRHAEHYRDVLSEADQYFLQVKEGVLKGLQLFDQEKTNILAGQSWAENNLKVNSSSSVINLCKSYPNIGAYVLDLRLSPREKISWLETALEACRKSNDKAAEGSNLGNLGLAYYQLGEPRQAIEFYDQALAISREIGNLRGEGNHLNNLGLAYSHLGDPRKAIEFYDQALAISHEIGDLRGEGNRLGNLGNAYSDLGDPRKAIEFYDQALAISHEIGDRRGEGADLGNLGNAYSDLGDPRKAIEFYDQALAITREIGDRRGEGINLGNLGNAYHDLGDPRKAIEFYDQALAISHEIGDHRGEGVDLGNLGLAYFYLGNPRKAIEFYERALQISREIGDRRSEGANLGNLGSAYSDLGDLRKAIEFYEQALAITREIGDRRGEGINLGNLGSAYFDLGNPKKAIEFYDMALQISLEIGDRRGEGYQLFNMSLSLHALGQNEEAVSLAKSALAIYEQIESPFAETVRKKLAEWGD